MTELWITPVATVVPLVVSGFLIRGYLRKIVRENLKESAMNLKKYSETKETECFMHGSELADLRDTNRVMLKCHHTELLALEKISKGEDMNGEIGKQQEELQQHMYENFAKK